MMTPASLSLPFRCAAAFGSNSRKPALMAKVLQVPARSVWTSPPGSLRVLHGMRQTSELNGTAAIVIVASGLLLLTVRVSQASQFDWPPKLISRVQSRMSGSR
jgi:hypothetical protein